MNCKNITIVLFVVVVLTLSTLYQDIWNPNCPFDLVPQDVEEKLTSQPTGGNETPPFSAQPLPKTRRPQFIPFPHNPLPHGIDAKCEWVARDPSDHMDPVVQSLLGSDVDSPDKIQKSSFKETICLGENMSNLHLFSAIEARTCLQGITLLITGDSYNRHLFIGLADILLNKVSNKKLKTSKRRARVLDSRQKSVKSLNECLGTDVQWGCNTPCYGAEGPFDQICSDCLNDFRRQHANRTVVPVVGAAVHIYSSTGGSANVTLNYIRGLFEKTDGGIIFNYIRGLFEKTDGGIIFNSPPNYNMAKVPDKYKHITVQRAQIYNGLLEMLPLWESKVRFLDFKELTESCRFDNCTADGGHRHRFVNRWKAQLLLNTICSVSPR